MEWCQSKNGLDVVMLEKESYLNFGKDKEIHWAHLSYIDNQGIRRGEIVPVSLNNLQREFRVIIGKDNLTILKGLIKTRLEGETLTRKKFHEIGEAVNLGERQAKKEVKVKKPRKRKSK